MTEKEFSKTAFKKSMLIEYKHSKMTEPIICLLCAVDFDEEIITIEPLENPRGIENKHHVHIKHCTIHDKKIRKLDLTTPITNK